MENLFALPGAAVNADYLEDTSPLRLVLDYYDREHTPLVRYLCFLNVNPETAKEIVQDCFIKLHEHLQADGDTTNLRAWLYRVAHNLARNSQLSAQARKTESLTGVTAQKEVAAFDLSAEDRMLEAERMKMLREGITRAAGGAEAGAGSAVAGFEIPGNCAGAGNLHLNGCRKRSTGRGCPEEDCCLRRIKMKSSIDSNHLSQEMILRMSDDELTASARLECESHLAVCEVCRQELASLHEFSAEIELAVQSTPIPALDTLRSEIQERIQSSSHPSPVLQHPGKIMLRFGWGMGIAATLAFGILVAPRQGVNPDLVPPMRGWFPHQFRPRLSK